MDDKYGKFRPSQAVTEKHKNIEARQRLIQERREQLQAQRAFLIAQRQRLESQRERLRALGFAELSHSPQKSVRHQS